MTLKELKQNGPYAWPGGYALVAIMGDCEPMCFACVTTEPEVHEEPDGDRGWLFLDAEIYWEGPTLQCAHRGKAIESEYGDPDAETEEQK